VIEPAESRVSANGIEHHVLTWENRPAPGAPPGKGTVVICHGFLDLAWSFAPVADRLAAAGYRVAAFDWRGHGETGHVGTGGYYHFPDYLLDLDELLPQLAAGERVHLVGHSMGGTACAMYGGLRPERLRTLTVIEGLGPPAEPPEAAPDRFLAWFDSVGRARGAGSRPIASVDEVVERMRVQNPELPEELGRFLAEKSTRVGSDGARRFTFDPLHRTRSPVPFNREVFLAFTRRITVPCLVVVATDGLRLVDEDERVATIPRARVVDLGPVGHMMHWHAPGPLADAVLAFIDAT
jgi:pimeloyl-ACP methyl ester carboxylesterase